MHHSITPRSLFATGAALALFAQSASAQDLDLSVVGDQLIQSIQYGDTRLVGERSTMLRVGVQATGTIPAGAEFDGLMRIFVDGAEIEESPIYSINGPLPISDTLALGDLDSTLNFVFRAPLSPNVELVAEFNGAGPNQVPEVDFANNSFSSGIVEFECAAVPDMMWVPIDYRPGGGATPNLPDPALIEPGVGDNFIQGIYPTKDWEYRRSDAPSKLWTGSLSGSGSSLNASLLTDLQMSVPQPDLIYGWVPGGLPYNGQAIGIPGQAAMGNTQATRHQRTFAHELGHLFNLQHNSTDVVVPGVDVEHHLAITQGLPQIKISKKDIMAAGLLTPQAWIAPNSYQVVLNNSIFACAAPLLASDPGAERLLVTGLWNSETGELELSPAVAFQGGRASDVYAKEDSDLLVRAYQGDTMVQESGIQARHAVDSCSVCAESGADSEFSPSPVSAFVHVFPSGIDHETVDRLVVVNARTGETVSELVRSSNAPEVAFVTPTADTLLGESLSVSWSGSDLDGDDLTYYLRYSNDGERFSPLATAVKETSITIPFGELPELRPGRGFLELLATDGLNTTVVRTEGLGGEGGTLLAAGSNPPMVYVLTPDTGKSFPKAGTVLLHSSGWDFEDLAINGSSIVWSSDLDGIVATGRTTSTAGLTVGTHVLTVTGTDLSGLSTSDTTTVTITDRDLPGTSGEICQADVGFGGPGTASLEFCGGDLSSGTTADLRLTGGAPNALLILGVGPMSNPMPLFGGTMVPSPINTLIVDSTDATGAYSINGVLGGGGPFSVFAQAIIEDAGVTGGFAFSNAVRADFLP